MSFTRICDRDTHAVIHICKREQKHLRQCCCVHSTTTCVSNWNTPSHTEHTKRKPHTEIMSVLRDIFNATLNRCTLKSQPKNIAPHSPHTLTHMCIGSSPFAPTLRQCHTFDRNAAGACIARDASSDAAARCSLLASGNARNARVHVCPHLSTHACAAQPVCACRVL